MTQRPDSTEVQFAFCTVARRASSVINAFVVYSKPLKLQFALTWTAAVAASFATFNCCTFAYFCYNRFCFPTLICFIWPLSTQAQQQALLFIYSTAMSQRATSSFSFGMAKYGTMVIV